MGDLNFYNKKPSCFKIFDLIDIELPSSGWVTGPEFLSKQIVCGCGYDRLNVYASFGENMNLAPILVECQKCGIKEEIFNPETDGWDGKNGDNCSLVGETEPRLLSRISPARLVVEYSYQGAENYEELVAEGVNDPENYFDTFALFSASTSGKLTEVVSYECA